MSDFILQDKELAGFDLGGYRQLNNTVKINGTDRFIDDWPKEISLLGNTYELEDVVKGAVDERTGEQWENAIYA